MSSSTNKLLTIIVPTYNRRELLAKGLEALIPQVSRYNDLVSLYVSDNYSDDGTEATVRNLQAQHPEMIEYKKQPTNLGAQENFKDAVMAATSKYVVMMSDDDVVLPNYLDTIIKYIGKYNDIALINYNALCFRNGRYVGVRDSYANYGVAKFYLYGGDFIKDHTHSPSVISSNVFVRELFVDTMHKIDQGRYPGYWWFAVLLNSIIDKKCCYIDVPLFVVNYPSQTRWRKNAALYYVCGLSRLFSDLDAIHSGILDAWKIDFENIYKKESLKAVEDYRSYYKDQYTALLKASVSADFSLKMKYSLFYPRWVCGFIFNLWPRIIRKLRSICHV